MRLMLMINEEMEWLEVRNSIIGCIVLYGMDPTTGETFWHC